MSQVSWLSILGINVKNNSWYLKFNIVIGTVLAMLPF
jgi:hypothetical protein